MSILIRGFLQIPEVRSRISPDFPWDDNINQVRVEYGKVTEKIQRVEANLERLKNGGWPQPLRMHLINKDVVSITRSLRFMDARLASLNTELEVSLLQAPSIQRASLNLHLQEIKALQASCGNYHRNLQEVSQKAQYFQARLQTKPGRF
ncbi:MAG: hypothetical protein C4567_08365 [Deltaproteobacteria bacterium]|nr:MAG: hypothetical protein C4567_08365 [Deltaproteobacteria bacterium]